jgi:3-hydroxyisobutyrate dehydrogenase-like beta-hydroxyacid dehydrogenase
MTRIGFLGLGNMGSAMARRLVDAGHDVIVWNRTPRAAAELVAAGASLASTAAEALAAPASFSMLANDEAAEAVLTVENLSGEAGRIHVNTASISAAAADRLERVHREAGVGYVASPVLGRPSVAAAGNLNLMVAGPDELVERVMPFLEPLSVRVWRFGEHPRRANVAKVSMNFMLLHAMQAMAESITLVEAHGIDASDFMELATNSLFGGVAYGVYGPMIAERRYRPAGFSMALGLKDLSLAEDLAEEGGIVLPTAAVIRDRFERALADEELADLDWSAMAEVTRRR